MYSLKIEYRNKSFIEEQKVFYSNVIFTFLIQKSTLVNDKTPKLKEVLFLFKNGIHNKYVYILQIVVCRWYKIFNFLSYIGINILFLDIFPPPPK